MSGYIVDSIATEQDFEEWGYLNANPDVAKAIKQGTCSSAIEHFREFGRYENRLQRLSAPLAILKKNKRRRMRHVLREDMPFFEGTDYIDYLTPDLRVMFNIVDTDNISSNNYDRFAQELIDKYSSGLILDCGSGMRSVYYDNVVNFEIADYDTTDVRGVGEELPFKDSSFDAVFSIAVLEHVKEPFKCAREIARVLKPGGDLFCSVPFLQPVHGYPNHYYNMTGQGLRNLFEPSIEITRHDVFPYAYPIWALNWILRSWVEGLNGETKSAFLSMKVEDLLVDPTIYIEMPFVKQLSREKNFELACGTTIFGTKKPLKAISQK